MGIEAAAGSCKKHYCSRVLVWLLVRIIHAQTTLLLIVKLRACLGPPGFLQHAISILCIVINTTITAGANDRSILLWIVQMQEKSALVIGAALHLWAHDVGTLRRE
jgi:hypothetical protein